MTFADAVPVYSLAEHASQIIRDFHNGVLDPDSNNPSNPTSGSNNGTNPKGNGNNNDGGAPPLPAPSVFTSADSEIASSDPRTITPPATVTHDDMRAAAQNDHKGNPSRT